MQEENVDSRAALFVICAALFNLPFMLSSVGVALPSIGKDLHATAMQLGLIETSYTLAVSIFLLTMGRVGDIYGRKRLFFWGQALFLVATASLSFINNIAFFISFRFMQGMGGAMINASSLAILVSIYPNEQRGRVLGIATSVVYAGVSCGPMIGGFLTNAFGWRSIFTLSIPLGLACLYLTATKLKREWRESQGEPFDWRGAVVYALSFLSISAGAARLAEDAWSLYALLAGFFGLGIFFFMQGRTTHPLLDTMLLRTNKIFSLSCLSSMVNYASTFGVMFFMSLYLQFVKGLQPSEAGLILMVQPVVQMILSPFGGKISDKLPAAQVATFGMALCVVALWVAGNIGEHTPMLLIFVTLALLGTGYAFFSSPNASVIMGSVEKRHLGVASGMTGTMRTTGMMISMIIITVSFSLMMHGKAVSANTIPDFLKAMQIDLKIFAALCACGVLFSCARWEKQNSQL